MEVHHLPFVCFFYFVLWHAYFLLYPYYLVAMQVAKIKSDEREDLKVLATGVAAALAARKVLQLCAGTLVAVIYYLFSNI